MTNRYKYTPTKLGYMVWARAGLVRLGAVRRLRSRAWAAYYDGDLLVTGLPTRDAAADELRREHQRRWGPLDKIVTIQFSPSTDHVTEEGLKLTKRPYPFHLDRDGKILRQELWHGDPLRLVGFAADLAREQIDLHWDDAYREPQKAVGMYAVTQDSKGAMAVHLAAVESVSEQEVS